MTTEELMKLIKECADRQIKDYRKIIKDLRLEDEIIATELRGAIEGIRIFVKELEDLTK